MASPFGPIPYGKQQLHPDDEQAVLAVLRDNFWTQGARIQAFEQAFAQYVGAPHATAVSSGTAALHLSALALGIKPGSRVLTSPMTFVATANCVRYAGGEVEFVDIDPQTYLLDINAVEQQLASKPKGHYRAIIPVDYAGLPTNLEAYRALADTYGCKLLEDACHAPGGSFKNSLGEEVLCGSGHYAQAAIFSFHPVKHIAAGEGGMVTTAHANVKAQADRLRSHGIIKEPHLLQYKHEAANGGDWYYEIHEQGFNYRMPDILCALGLSQLKRAKQGLARRHELASNYRQAFQELPISCQHVPEGHQHAYHLFVITCRSTEERERLYYYLRERDIFCQVHYVPVHLLPLYRQLGHKPGDYPQTERHYACCLSLPLYPSLTDEQQGYVIDQVRGFFNN